jgi:hypothetical protein
MKQIARKTAPGWKKLKQKKHKYPPFQSPKAGHPSLWPRSGQLLSL